MYKAGCCNFVGLLTCLFLFGCNADQPSLETQIKEDLHKVLKNVSQIQVLSKKLAIPPPTSGMLSADHLEMYVWVTARATQLYLARENSVDKNRESTSEATALVIVDKSEQQDIPIDSTPLEIEYQPAITKGELTALSELDLDQELYLWVKTTVNNTVEFIDATGESEIADLVTLYDPVIKHNISLVQKYRKKFKYTENYSSKSQNARSLWSIHLWRKPV